MTLKYINKIQTYFKDEDTSGIVCNILENFHNLEMAEFIDPVLLEGGYLQLILDFFKDCYPIFWKELNNHNWKYNFQNRMRFFSYKIETVTSKEEQILLAFAISNRVILRVVETRFEIDLWSNDIFCSSINYPINDNNKNSINIELPLGANKLCLGEKSDSAEGVVHIVNGGDLELEELTFNNRGFIVKGLNAITHIPTIKLISTIYEQLDDLPQSCSLFSANRWMNTEIWSNDQYLDIKIDTLSVSRAEYLKPFKYVKKLLFNKDSIPDLWVILNVVKTMSDKPAQIIVEEWVLERKYYTGEFMFNEEVVQKYVDCGYELQLNYVVHSTYKTKVANIIFTLKNQ